MKLHTAFRPAVGEASHCPKAARRVFTLSVSGAISNGASPGSEWHDARNGAFVPNFVASGVLMRIEYRRTRKRERRSNSSLTASRVKKERRVLR